MKLKVEVDGFNWDRCNQLYKQSTGIRLIQSQLCAGGKDGEDSCQGDSGNENDRESQIMTVFFFIFYFN